MWQRNIFFLLYWQTLQRSIAILTTWCQTSLSLAFLQAVRTPKFKDWRSSSIVLSQVVLGRPTDLQSAGDLNAAAMTWWWSSPGAVRASPKKLCRSDHPAQHWWAGNDASHCFGTETHECEELAYLYLSPNSNPTRPGVECTTAWSSSDIIGIEHYTTKPPYSFIPDEIICNILLTRADLYPIRSCSVKIWGQFCNMAYEPPFTHRPDQKKSCCTQVNF